MKDKKNEEKEIKKGCCCKEDKEQKCNCGDTCECNNNEDKSAEYLELAQRIKAEFDNYKKRNAELAMTSYNNGIATAVNKLLPAIDSFNQARTNITDPATLSGIDLIFNQLMKGLNELNVEKIESVGQLFDPNIHNAVLVGNDETYPNETVLEEYQAGFIMNGKVIRPSTVKVNKLD